MSDFFQVIQGQRSQNCFPRLSRFLELPRFSADNKNYRPQNLLQTLFHIFFKLNRFWVLGIFWLNWLDYKYYCTRSKVTKHFFPLISVSIAKMRPTSIIKIVHHIIYNKFCLNSFFRAVDCIWDSGQRVCSALPHSL